MKIREMRVGQSARIVGYEKGDPAYRHKLLRMGLIKGSSFKLLRKAPMGDPVELELATFNLTLRKDEAEALKIELMDG